MQNGEKSGLEALKVKYWNLLNILLLYLNLLIFLYI
jgi:hypothetical protein